MTTSTLRKRVRQFVDEADENKLRAIYTLAIESAEESYQFSIEERKLLEKLDKQYLNSQVQTMTAIQVRKGIEKALRK